MTLSEKMEEIIQNNATFETIRVLMDILVKELGLPKTADMRQIVEKIAKTTDKYHKAVSDYKKYFGMAGKPANNDIRQ